MNAWHHTYGLPVVLTNCSNNDGPWQFPEKLITPVADRPGHDRRYAIDPRASAQKWAGSPTALTRALLQL